MVERDQWSNIEISAGAHTIPDLHKWHVESDQLFKYNCQLYKANEEDKKKKKIVPGYKKDLSKIHECSQNWEIKFNEKIDGIREMSTSVCRLF